MIGPGKAFDTDRFFVVSSNLLGGCRGSTGPSSTNPATGRPYGSDFPVITVADMVRAERALLDVLGIARLAAVAGGSLGGMQALEWATRYPDQVDAIVSIASTHALQPQGVAWNAIARSAITSDPDWQGAITTARGACPRPAWASREWWATSRISPPCRLAPSSAGGSSTRPTSATR
jgi:homoserine O-acetyltransferase